MATNAFGASNASGDLSYAAALQASGSGINLGWHYNVPINSMTAAEGSPSLAHHEIRASRVEGPGWSFDQTTLESIGFFVPLPPDYDGRALKATVLWTALAGTTGGVVWTLIPGAFIDDATLDLDTSPALASVTDTFIALKDLHVAELTSFTPQGAASGSRCFSGLLRRVPADVADTFDADAILIGLQLSYA